MPLISTKAIDRKHPHVRVQLRLLHPSEIRRSEFSPINATEMIEHGAYPSSRASEAKRIVVCEVFVKIAYRRVVLCA